MPPEPPPAALRLDIDKEALATNWRNLDRLSGKAVAGAAVKADGYGLGVSRVVPVLHEAGVRDFFVAHWSEVADVIDHVDPKSIAVLHGPANATEAVFARAIGVRPVINSLHQAMVWLEADGGACDLMIDTGINRLGLPVSDLSSELIKRLDIDVLHSHLASADEDAPLNMLQCSRWETARASLRHRRASLSNSAGIVLGDRFHGDLTRPGLSLYGGIPRSELTTHIAQVARPMAAVMQVRKIGPGDGVGYNSTFVADHEMRTGTIAIGYADGYLRCWSGVGGFAFRGQPLPVIGRISMDMTVLDLTAAPDLKEGDWVEADYSLPDAAAKSRLSQYELLTLLGQRFAR